MDARTDTSNRRQGRRWRFASAVLDERSWTLTVNGRVVPIEAKPLELLHELLLHAGEAVSKDQLLAAVWPEVSVVEGSLATAMLKVRRALGDEGAAAIQTVPRVGYKLAVPVELTFATPPELTGVAPGLMRPPGAEAPPLPASPAARTSVWPWPAFAAGVVLAVLGLSLAWRALPPLGTASAAGSVSQSDARDALRRLDLTRVETLLRAGWNPNVPFDNEGNAALHIVVTVCEWQPAHDRQQLLLVTKALLDASARPEIHNIWGDTAYSIARATRNCGPDHPVSRLLHVACFTGPNPIGDKCLPRYKQRAAEQRPP